MPCKGYTKRVASHTCTCSGRLNSTCGATRRGQLAGSPHSHPSPTPTLRASRALPPHPPHVLPLTRSGGRAAAVAAATAPSPRDPGKRPFRKDRLGVRG